MAGIVMAERGFVSIDPAGTGPPGAASRAAVPLANKTVVELELHRALRRVARRRERRGKGAHTAQVPPLPAAPQWRGEPPPDVGHVGPTRAPCPTGLARLHP